MSDAPASPNVRWAWPITLPICVLGLADAIYLTIAHYNTKVALVCSDKGHVNCAKVTTSPQSEIFGHIPVALTGLIYFVVMLAFCTPWAWNAHNEWIHRIRLAGAIGGFGMVIYLVFVEAVQLKAICLYCTGVHILTFFLFLTILAAYLLRPIDPAKA